MLAIPTFRSPCSLRCESLEVISALYRFDHDAESRFHTSCLCKRIQFIALYREDGLYFEDCSECGGSSGNTSAFFQVFEGIYCNINRGIHSFFFQNVPDLPCCESFFSQRFCIQYGECLGTEMRWLSATNTRSL